MWSVAMPKMKPSEYVRQYHSFRVNTVGPTGVHLSGTVHITKYQVDGSGERAKLLQCLKKLLGLKVLPNISTTTEAFYFTNDDYMDPVEPFYWQGLKRAFYFKASPAEMRDALRLAYRCGRIGNRKDVLGQPSAAMTLGEYGNKFFGLDCNGLVGNYFNLSPALYIGCYAEMSAKEEANVVKKVDASGYWNGWARAEALSLDYIPLAPRKSADEAKEGDILIDVQDGTNWAHIAIVEDVTVIDKDTVSWRVVEWGQGTNEKNFDTDKDNHIHPITTHKLTKGPKKSLGVGHTSMGGRRFRYLFEGPKVSFEPATWGRCGVEGV
jgi:hypothetical protein